MHANVAKIISYLDALISAKPTVQNVITTHKSKSVYR